MLTEFVLAGLQWQTCLVYLGDVIVYGQDFDEHLERLTNPRVFTIGSLRSTTRHKRKRRLKLQVQVSQSISPLCQFV